MSVRNVDVWRVTHPGVREYSWFSPRANNGFRIDHAYATPAVAGGVIACEFDRAPLELRETDHPTGGLDPNGRRPG